MKAAIRFKLNGVPDDVSIIQKIDAKNKAKTTNKEQQSQKKRKICSKPPQKRFVCCCQRYWRISEAFPHRSKLKIFCRYLSERVQGTFRGFLTAETEEISLAAVNQKTICIEVQVFLSGVSWLAFLVTLSVGLSTLF